MTTINLQGLGKVKAKPASELRVGDVLSWNYSPRCSEVVAIEPCGKKSLYVTERSRKTGAEYKRRLLKSRLVAA